MSEDVQLIVALSAMHVIAIAAGVGLLLLALHGGRPEPEPPPAGDDGDGGSRHQPSRPKGGPPLPDADPSPVRLRGPRRVVDVGPPRRRRPLREPRRTPTPTRTGPRHQHPA
jgi:hypothetical protein